MTADQIKSLKQMISIMSMYYGRKLDDPVITMYASDLEDLDFASVNEAMSKYRKDPKNRTMFVPAQIRQMVLPEDYITPEIQAREIAARICAAVPKYGYCNGPEARAFIGDIGWEVVQRQGGWSYICENLGVNINPSAFQAQLRDQLKGDIEFGGAIESKILSMPERKRGELTSASEIIKFIGSPNNTDPGAA